MQNAAILALFDSVKHVNSSADVACNTDNDTAQMLHQRFGRSVFLPGFAVCSAVR